MERVNFTSGLSAALYKSGTPSLTVMQVDPYRQKTYKRPWMEQLGGFLQSHGFNFLVLDVRGTGDSQGVALDEYSFEELADSANVIAAIIQQPWSNGQIVMHGKSYSGCTALQTLALGLSAVVSAFVVHATDDRWETDVHWWGGVKTVGDWLQYATEMTSFNMLPSASDPNCREPHPWVLNWLTKHPEYWKRGSISAEAHRISVPVFLYGGFHDLYAPAIVRMHKAIPHNLTIITHDGHDSYPVNHHELLLWWLRTFHQTQTQNIYYYTLYNRWVQGVPKGTLDCYWRTGGQVPLSLVCGPLFRFRANSVLGGAGALKKQLVAQGLRFRIPSTTSSSLLGNGLVTLQVHNPPLDYYLVAWIMDGEDRLQSMGVQRSGGKNHDVLQIRMSPICYPAAGLSLYLTTSNIPNLVPQFWLQEALVIKNCRLQWETGGDGDDLSGLPSLVKETTAVYEDTPLERAVHFDREELVLSVESEPPCEETAKREECETEHLTVWTDLTEMHAHFDHVTYGGTKLTLQSFTDLVANGKTGVLTVEVYCNGEKHSSWKQSFSL